MRDKARKAATMKAYRKSAKYKAYKAKYNADNREAILAYKRRYHQRVNVHRVRRDRYGVSVEQFDELFVAQEGACALCRRPFTTDSVRPPMIDHCHRSGRVRGLLCNRCNWALAVFDGPWADIDTVYRVLAYLGYKGEAHSGYDGAPGVKAPKKKG